MDLQQLLRVLRVRWKFIVVTLVIGSVLSTAFALTRSPSYESTGRIFIVAPNGSSGDAFPTLLVTQRASSYADLAKDPALLQKVLNRLQEPIPLAELSSRISVSVVVDTQIVQVTATGDTPQEAKDIADATVAQVLSLVATLERPTDDKPAAVVGRAAGDPTLNSSPVGPPMILYLIIGTLLSLMIGLMGAVLRDRLDLTIKAREDVEAVTGAPVISALPLDSSVARDRRSKVKPDSPLAEAFRVLRANLRFANLDGNGQMILVTSALPNEGKTLTAINLAQSLAATGQSVLLIDCDLRSPNVASNLGLENGVGMLSVLLNQVPLREAIQGDVSGLDVLPTGPRPPNPSEVLETDAVANLLSSVRELYDAVVLDAPPLLPVADASALAGLVDGVLVCARWGSVDADELQRSAALLDRLGAKLLGVVMTQVRGRATVAYGYGGEAEPAARGRGWFGRRSPAVKTVVVPAVLPRATKATSTRRQVPATRALVETSDG